MIMNEPKIEKVVEKFVKITDLIGNETVNLSNSEHLYLLAAIIHYCDEMGEKITALIQESSK